MTTTPLQKDLASDSREPDEALAPLERQRGDREGARAAEKAEATGAKSDQKFARSVVQAEARAMNRDPITGDPGSHPIGTGVGTTGGAVAGAAIGSIGGLAGTALGGVVGAIIGAAAGHAVGEAINPTAEESHWRDAYNREPYFNPNLDFDDYAPAFRAGYMYRSAYPERAWGAAEADLKAVWDNNTGTSRLSWHEAREAVLAAWRHAEPRSA
jgi:hypothetical protein